MFVQQKDILPDEFWKNVQIFHNFCEIVNYTKFCWYLLLTKICQLLLLNAEFAYKWRDSWSKYLHFLEETARCMLILSV